VGDSRAGEELKGQDPGSCVVIVHNVRKCMILVPGFRRLDCYIPQCFDMSHVLSIYLVVDSRLCECIQNAP
jgi:hypothetical protein